MKIISIVSRGASNSPSLITSFAGDTVSWTSPITEFDRKDYEWEPDEPWEWHSSCLMTSTWSLNSKSQYENPLAFHLSRIKAYVHLIQVMEPMQKGRYIIIAYLERLLDNINNIKADTMVLPGGDNGNERRRAHRGFVLEANVGGYQSEMSWY